MDKKPPRLTEDDLKNIFEWAYDGYDDDLESAFEEYGESLIDETLEDETLLIRAISGRHADTVKLLLEKKPALEATDRTGMFALLHAIWENSPKIVTMLLDAGADVNQKNNGRSALTKAVTAGNLGLAELLVSRGADLDVRDNEGKTLLMLAAWFGRPPVCKWLLEKGVSIDARDKDGKTALDWSEKNLVCAMYLRRQIEKQKLQQKEAELAAIAAETQANVSRLEQLRPKKSSLKRGAP